MADLLVQSRTDFVRKPEASPRGIPGKPPSVNSPSRTTSRPSRTDDKRNEAKSFGLFFVVVTLLLVWSGWNIYSQQLYTSRSTVGFYLGVSGSVMMMAALLGYPLRKRLRFMQRWGPVKHWFRSHMFLGLAGPILILFHATFHVRSINAGVALTSMLLVVASGVIGRFIYARIHQGLYGRRATMKQLQDHLIQSSEVTSSILSIAPRVEHLLKGFQRRALGQKLAFPENMVHAITLGVFRKWCEFRCRWELRRAWKGTASGASTQSPQQARQLIATYLKEIQRVAQFTLYERVFALWHVLHIPLIFILASSGIFHVIAVYMY